MSMIRGILGKRLTEVALRQYLNLSSASFLGVAVRRRMLTLAGLRLAGDAKISRGTRLGGRDITLGAGSGANEECWIDNNVTLGRNVRLGPRVAIITSTHAIGPAAQRRGADDISRPVSIDDGTWIQTGAVVLPGAHVAAGCVILAHAVVTKPTAPHGIYAGVPARRVGDLAVERRFSDPWHFGRRSREGTRVAAQRSGGPDRVRVHVGGNGH